MSADRPTAEAQLSDYGLITPIALPIDGRMPDAATGAAGKAEYDDYFRLIRERPDLTAWSQSCLDVQRQILADLDLTELSAEDRCDILAGCLVVLHATLERWVTTGGHRRREVA
ncbi:hypothetical protein AB0H57_17065 [Micromonospora sp. NPDC050686]|uniref:hypothetical protein n=1 Tax=Micromonospora sp. NPDC050686 TaxID=3154631 RepID=UPI0033D4FCDB